eukprot:2552716-Rhodomonas_salina.1
MRTLGPGDPPTSNEHAFHQLLHVSFRDAHVLSTSMGTQDVHRLCWRGQGLPPQPHTSFSCKNSSGEFPWEIKPFSSFHPDLSVITEDESEICGWPEDMHDIAVDVAENFTRPGLLRPVRGGGDFWRKTTEVVLHSIPSFILLLLSHLPPEFWSAAAHYWTDVYNHVPHSSIDDQIPHSVHHGTKPDI